MLRSGIYHLSGISFHEMLGVCVYENVEPTSNPTTTAAPTFLQGGVEAAEKLLGKDDLFDPEDCGNLLSKKKKTNPQIDGSVGLKLVVDNRRCFCLFSLMKFRK